MAKQPIAEFFGFPPDSNTSEAERFRRMSLCPYNNKIPNCTKDSVTNPLGVCSIFHKNDLAVICPVRLRQDWIIAENAASFFFPEGTRWTTLVEVRLTNKDGKSAGNIDVVLVAYDENGTVTDFGSLEVQTVYISGSLRKNFFQPLMDNREEYLATDWNQSRKKNPTPDYLSSSRKRLAPQLIYKGGILNAWGCKQAVAVHRAFYSTMPELPEVSKDQADIAWLVYDMVFDQHKNCYKQILAKTVYTEFQTALDKITISEPGPVGSFIANLQLKLDAKLDGTNSDQFADLPNANESDLIDELENL